MVLPRNSVTMSNSRPLNRLIDRTVLSWGLVPLFWGCYYGYSIFQTYQIAAQQDDWLPTKAVVTESWRRRSTDSLTCHFRYEYVVDDKLFSSRRYTADGRKCVGQQMFDESDVIEAYYNPDNPRLAVVEKLPPSPFLVLGFAIASILLFLVGLSWSLAALKTVLRK